MLSHRWRRPLTLRQALTAPGAGKTRPRPVPPRVEELEPRTLPSVTIAPTNNNGQGYAALDFNRSGGYVPPDTCGAAGPTNYVETVNQTIGIFTPKATGTTVLTSSFSNFWLTVGGLPRVDANGSFSDPIVVYDDNMPGQTPTTGRFIVGDQNIDFNTGVSVFDFAVSKTSSPATLTAADWNFYQINTTETGYSSDYPGNFGYNQDAFVFTLNQFGSFNHVQVTSVNATDLVNGVARNSLRFFQNDISDFSLRPTAMHDAPAGAPMWLVTDTGDGTHIDVYKIANILSHFSAPPSTRLAVNPYSNVVPPRQPNNTIITNNISSLIDKAAEANNTLVASQAVALSSTQDAARWYVIDVSSGTPVLQQQGDVSLGNNTYATYPAIDINPSGQIGLTFMDSGTGAGQFLSMYVTGRLPTDPSGTMEPVVQVPAGTGLTNYHDFTSGGRAGDLSGISVDPADGSFWAASEFANTEATANWGTAVANFTLGPPPGPADVAVTNSGQPPVVDVTAGPVNVTYTITVTNNGPSAAQNFVLTDSLPAGSVFVSMTQTAGSDSFTFAQSGGTVTETVATLPAGSSDTFSLVVTAPANLANGADFSDTASVSSLNPDPNTANNTATVSRTVVNNNPAADLAVSLPGPTTATEGDTLTYTLTVTNNGPADAPATVLTDTLPSLVRFVSATTSQGTFSQSGGVVTFSLGTIPGGQSATATISAQVTEDDNLTDTASVSSSAPDPNTGNNSTSLTTVVSEPNINVSGPINSSSRTLTNVTVATFTHANGVEAPGAFIATINWGDGSTSTGTVSQSGSTYSVTGSHSYKNGKSHTIKTTVVESGTGPNGGPDFGGGGSDKGGDDDDGGPDGGGAGNFNVLHTPPPPSGKKGGGKGTPSSGAGAGKAAGLVATLTTGKGGAVAPPGAGLAVGGGREGRQPNVTAGLAGSHTAGAATGTPGNKAAIDLFFLLSGGAGHAAHPAGWDFSIKFRGPGGR